MSAGGLSYSGLTTSRKATLPSVEMWNTNMNILRDPNKGIFTRRKDKVGDTQEILLAQEDSGDRIAECINVYARGVNPMVSVSYDNYGNNGGSRSSIGTKSGGVKLPYKPEVFRPPIVRQEELMPLSRQPRVWFYALTNPELPNIVNEMNCSETKSSTHTRAPVISKPSSLQYIYEKPLEVVSTTGKIQDNPLQIHNILSQIKNPGETDLTYFDETKKDKLAKKNFSHGSLVTGHSLPRQDRERVISSPIHSSILPPKKRIKKTLVLPNTFLGEKQPLQGQEKKLFFRKLSNPLHTNNKYIHEKQSYDWIKKEKQLLRKYPQSSSLLHRNVSSSTSSSTTQHPSTSFHKTLTKKISAPLYISKSDSTRGYGAIPPKKINDNNLKQQVLHYPIYTNKNSNLYPSSASQTGHSLISSFLGTTKTRMPFKEQQYITNPSVSRHVTPLSNLNTNPGIVKKELSTIPVQTNACSSSASRSVYPDPEHSFKNNIIPDPLQFAMESSKTYPFQSSSQTDFDSKSPLLFSKIPSSHVSTVKSGEKRQAPWINERVQFHTLSSNHPSYSVSSQKKEQGNETQWYQDTRQTNSIQNEKITTEAFTPKTYLDKVDWQGNIYESKNKQKLSIKDMSTSNHDNILNKKSIYEIQSTSGNNGATFREKRGLGGFEPKQQGIPRMQRSHDYSTEKAIQHDKSVFKQKMQSFHSSSF